MRSDEIDVIAIPQMTLRWSEWYSWEDIRLDARSPGGVHIPNGQCGVYQAKLCDQEECLTIGRASDLRMRVRQGLVKGKVPHSEGARIREHEDTPRIVVRWAVCDRPAAVEEELHRRHVTRFGSLPKHVKRT